MSVVDDLGRELVEAALLEGDFLLRRGKRSRWYLDKYRFETRSGPAPRARRAPRGAVREVEPETVRIAGPALGAVALAASASMASGLPFIIVRGETKEYGTANRIEGPHEVGELVCLVEDVVTSGGALCEAVEAVRAAGLVVRTRSVRRRPGGGRRRRTRTCRRAALLALPASELLAARIPRRPAWLSRTSRAVGSQAVHQTIDDQEE